MRRIITTTALAAALVAGPAPAGAAAAGPGVCTGTWAMHTTFEFDLVRPMRHSFEMTPTGATCVPDRVASAVGELNGMCFGATGGGVMDGRGFSLTWRGASLVFTGGVTGTLTIAADPSTGTDRCVGGAADDFVLAGTLTLA